MPVTYDEIWEKEFEPALATQRAREGELQTEAFLDVALELCGEPVRQMTPVDLLHLDALDNPFISGSKSGDVHFLDCAGFIWELAVENNHTNSLANLWRRRRFVRRLAPLDLTALVNAICDYVDRMTLERPEPKTAEQRERERQQSIFTEPPRTHFLAPLLVNLAGDIGHIDPMSGRILAETPLPRLIQYGRQVDRKKDGPKTYNELHSLRNRCMDRVNQINNAERFAPVEEAIA